MTNRKIVLICWLSVSPLFVFSQNIFANGDLEEGPWRFDLGLFFLERDSANNRVADSWIGTDIYDSVDTFNDSIPGGTGGLPQRNSNGDAVSVDYIFSGSKCIAANYSFLRSPNAQGTFENREYFTNFLARHTSRDSIYCISCMSSASSTMPVGRSLFALSNYSVWFTSGYPEDIRSSFREIRNPMAGQVVNLYPVEFEFLEDTLEWQQLQGLFVPKESARYATFGIFDTLSQYEGKVLKFAQDTTIGEFTSYNYFDAFEGFSIARKPFLKENYLACEFSSDELIYEPSMPYDLFLNGVQVIDSLFSLLEGEYEYEIVLPCGSYKDTILVSPSLNSLEPIQVTQCSSQGELELNLEDLFPEDNGVFWTESGAALDISVDRDTTIEVSFINECGLTLNSNVVVDFIPSVIGKVDTLSFLDVNLPAEIDLTQFYSSDSLLMDLISVSEAGTYQYSVKTECGTISSRVVIIVEEVIVDIPSWFFPTGFSPNGDGLNDTWKVFYSDDSFELVEVLIFDRWGELVFIGETKDDAWDGINPNTGENFHIGVYAVLSRYRAGPDAEETFFEGTITLVR
jgi:gliding motility-associated-like protein